MWLHLQFIQSVTDRYGRRRHYFRRRGCPRIKLPGALGSPEFITAYEAALAAGPDVASEPVKKGTFEALVRDYETSAEFVQLGKLTRREMGYVLNGLVKRHGEKPVALLERKHILKWRDELSSKPGASNKLVRTVKVLMSFAVDRGYRKDNPALNVKMMKLGEYRPWTNEELTAFEAKWPLGTLERSAFALALYTGQRRADLAKLTWTSIAGGKLHLVQGKTGEPITIPLHPDLKVALAAVHPRHEAAILASKTGKAFNPIYLGHLMATAIKAAGLPDACVLHGLRKSAVVALIDIGCTPHQAAAITGHQTMRMLEHYAKRRDQAALGKAAMLKWGRSKRGGNKA